MSRQDVKDNEKLIVYIFSIVYIIIVKYKCNRNLVAILGNRNLIVIYSSMV